MNLSFCKRLGLPLRSRLGEPTDQKLTDELKGLVGSFEASHASKESMDHAFPYIEAGIDSCRRRQIHEANGIIEQHLVTADVHTDRG